MPTWLRHLVGGAAVLAALGAVGWAVLPTGPSDSSGPQFCFAPPLAPEPPVVGAGDADAGLREANRLAEAGELGLAERLYEAALEGGDVRAAAGLEHVEARRGAAERVAASAQRLARAGLGDDADACFQSALALDPANAAARTGLTPDERVFPARAADRWDAFYSRWLGPSWAFLVPALGVLAVLLVLARLLTPVVAPGAALAWPDGLRTAAWWSGLALVVMAVVRGIALLGWPPARADGIDQEWRTPVAAGLAALVLLTVWLGAHARTLRDLGTRAQRLELPRAAAGWLGGALSVLGLLAVVALGRALPDVPDDGWPWVLSAGVAALGVALLAVGRGHALRLHVAVRAGNAADAAGTSYVLARLQDLGTSPPEGLKAPQQVDVVDLPAEALKGLPAGKVATFLASAAGLVQPSVPWRATVEDHADGWMTVTVTRNGAVVRTAIVDGERFRKDPMPEKAAAGGDATAAKTPPPDSRNRLTAAAAVILTEVAVGHPRLERGLCGATQWDSVAAHVVATLPANSSPEDEEFRRRLQAFAVQRDPRNALARAAYVQRLGAGDGGLDGFRAQARRLEDLLKVVEWQRRDPFRVHGSTNGAPPPARTDDDGYLPLRLRITHSAAAAWLNAAASDGAEPADLDAARTAVACFGRLLGACGPEAGADTFVQELSSVHDELQVALAVLRPGRWSEEFPGTATWYRPRSLEALYDRACALAVEVRNREPGSRGSTALQALAQEDLRLAEGLPRLRAQSATDPWLRRLPPRNGSG